MNNRNVFLGSRGWKSKIKAPTWSGSVSAESLLPGSEGAIFLLYPRMAERGSKPSEASDKDTNPVCGGSTLRATSNPN